MFLFLVGSKSNVSAVFWLRFRMVWALFLSLFNGFQQQRFGIFPATVSQWLGHKTCWGSAFSHARPKHLFLEFGLVACRLPSLTLRKGLLCLRRLFFFVFSRFQKQRFGSFLAAVSINTKGLEYPRNLSAVTKPLFRPSAPNFAVSSVRGRRHGRQPFNNLTNQVFFHCSHVCQGLRKKHEKTAGVLNFISFSTVNPHILRSKNLSN